MAISISILSIMLSKWNLIAISLFVQKHCVTMFACVRHIPNSQPVILCSPAAGEGATVKQQTKMKTVTKC